MGFGAGVCVCMCVLCIAGELLSTTEKGSPSKSGQAKVGSRRKALALLQVQLYPDLISSVCIYLSISLSLYLSTCPSIPV